jgi:RNA polymerase sigma-70 factor (family 1)
MESHEEKLIKELRMGNKKAFEYFFNGYYQNLLNLANQYLHDLDEAEDIVQEVFYRVWHYKENMDPSLSFKAYIITIAKRLIYNKFKKKVHKITFEKYLKENKNNTENSLDEYINFTELDQRINFKIQQLPLKRREIFILSRQEGLSNKEIAEKLNISPNTVESQITKAIKFLRESVISLFLFMIQFYV